MIHKAFIEAVLDREVPPQVMLEWANNMEGRSEEEVNRLKDQYVLETLKYPKRESRSLD